MAISTHISTLLSPYLAIFAVATAVTGASLYWWALRYPRIALYTLVASLVLGQVIRLPLPGQGGGLLLSDFAVVLVLAVSVSRMKKVTSLPMYIKSYVVWSMAFLSWSLISLVVHAPYLELTGYDTAIALSYWLRLTCYLSLLLALYVLPIAPKEYRKIVIATGIGMALLGLVQLLILPSLTSLSRFGFDPHQNRLVATWLDPNFIGLLFIGTFWGSLAFIKSFSGTIWYRLGVLNMVASACSIALTKSRSTLLAFLVTLVVWAVLYAHANAHRIFSKRIIVRSISGLLITSVLLAGVIYALGSRGLASAYFDPTASLRVQSYVSALEVIQEYPIGGTGYNAYQFGLAKLGIGVSSAIHSRAGSDSSLLTLLATTGIVGVLIIISGITYFIGFLVSGTTEQSRGAVTAVCLVVVAVLVHSQFVNSMLYPHLLIAWAILLRSAYEPSSISTN